MAAPPCLLLSVPDMCNIYSVLTDLARPFQKAQNILEIEKIRSKYRMAPQEQKRRTSNVKGTNAFKVTFDKADATYYYHLEEVLTNNLKLASITCITELQAWPWPLKRINCSGDKNKIFFVFLNAP